MRGDGRQRLPAIGLASKPLAMTSPISRAIWVTSARAWSSPRSAGRTRFKTRCPRTAGVGGGDPRAFQAPMPCPTVAPFPRPQSKAARTPSRPSSRLLQPGAEPTDGVVLGASVMDGAGPTCSDAPACVAAVGAAIGGAGGGVVANWPMFGAAATCDSATPASGWRDTAVVVISRAARPRSARWPARKWPRP